MRNSSSRLPDDPQVEAGRGRGGENFGNNCIYQKTKRAENGRMRRFHTAEDSQPAAAYVRTKGNVSVELVV